MCGAAKGVLGLLLSLMVAVAVYAYTDDADVRAVFGAGTLPGCKQKCTNGSVDVKECLDPCNFFHPKTPCAAGEIAPNSGGKCNKNFCTVNTLRYYSCETGNPGSGESPCDYKSDPGFRRQHNIYEQACTTTGADSDKWTCKRQGTYAGWKTPCKTTDCGTGVLKNTHDYPGRRVCDP